MNAHVATRKPTAGARELQILACFVHGSLASLHALGLVYNLRKGNRFESAFHACAVVFDCWATRKHYRQAKGVSDVVPVASPWRTE